MNTANIAVTSGTEYSSAAVLNLWAAAHWWAADLCLVGRDLGWELRNFFDVGNESQSMKRYKVLIVERASDIGPILK